jgi:hypothetical protein
MKNIHVVRHEACMNRWSSHLCTYCVYQFIVFQVLKRVQVDLRGECLAYGVQHHEG